MCLIYDEPFVVGAYIMMKFLYLLHVLVELRLSFCSNFALWPERIKN
jgi:hypothetical protein